MLIKMLFSKKKKEIKWFENLAFLIGLFFMGYILLSIFYFHNFVQNLIYILIFVILNATILLIVPKIILENSVIESYQKGMHKFANLINNVVSKIALAITYIIGVGFVWAFSRILKKKFLDVSSDKKSYWIKKQKKSESFREMF